MGNTMQKNDELFVKNKVQTKRKQSVRSVPLCWWCRQATRRS